MDLRAATCLFLLATMPLPSLADRVVMKNGAEIIGVIVEDDERRVVIESNGARLPIERSRIESVVYESADVGVLATAAASLRNGNIASAFERLVAAVEAGSPPEAVDEVLSGNRAWLYRGLERVDESERTAILAAGRQLSRSPSLGGQSHMVLARAFDQVGAWSDASDAIRRAGPEAALAAPPEGWAIDLMRRTIRRLIVQGRYHEAVEQIERLRLLAPDEAGTQEPLVVIAAAARARDAGDYERALRLLGRDLAAGFPEVARNRLVLTISRTVEWASETSNEAPARRWILDHAAALLPVEALSAIQRLHESEAARLVRAGAPVLAKRLVDAIPEPDRTPELQRLHDHASFEVRRDALEPDDAVGIMELAQWAAERRMYPEALQLFSQARGFEPVRALADEQVQLVRRQRDTELLERALLAYERGLVRDALEMATAVLNNADAESQLSREARRLARVAERELDLEAARRPYDAEVLYQEAERATLMDRPDEAWELVDLILLRFGDTPAAARAEALLPDIMWRYRMQLLEGRRTTPPPSGRPVDLAALDETDALAREVSELMRGIALERAGREP